MARSNAYRPIKSIQRGIISVAQSSFGTATISAVDTTRAELTLLGSSNSFSRISLTDATTVRVDHSGIITASTNFQVTEYF